MGQMRFVTPQRQRLPPGAVEQAYLTGMEPVALKSAVSEGKVPDIAADVSGQARLSLARRADLLALESSLVLI